MLSIKVGGAAAAGYLAYKVLSNESGGVYLGSVAIGGVTEGDNAAFLKQQERYTDYVDNMRYDPDTFEFGLKKEQKWDSKKWNICRSSKTSLILCMEMGV